MFCNKCGKEINEDAVVCVHCGCAIQKAEHNQSKTGIGVVMALFIGLIGLVIGLVMYPADSVARRTFIKGWGITYGVCIGVAILIYIIMFSAMLSAPMALFV